MCALSLFVNVQFHKCPELSVALPDQTLGISEAAWIERLREKRPCWVSLELSNVRAGGQQTCCGECDDGDEQGALSRADPHGLRRMPTSPGQSQSQSVMQHSACQEPLCGGPAGCSAALAGAGMQETQEPGGEDEHHGLGEPGCAAEVQPGETAGGCPVVEAMGGGDEEAGGGAAEPCEGA